MPRAASRRNPWDRPPAHAHAPVWVLPEPLLRAADLLSRAPDGCLLVCMNQCTDRRDPAYQLLVREGLRRGLNLGRFEEAAYMAARDLLALPRPLLDRAAAAWSCRLPAWHQTPEGPVEMPPSWFVGDLFQYHGAGCLFSAATRWHAYPIAPVLPSMLEDALPRPAGSRTGGGRGSADASVPSSAAARGSSDPAPAPAPPALATAPGADSEGAAPPAPATATDDEGTATENDAEYQREKRLTPEQQLEITRNGLYPRNLPGTWRRRVRHCRLPGQSLESAEEWLDVFGFGPAD